MNGPGFAGEEKNGSIARSVATKQSSLDQELDCFASLAMTNVMGYRIT
jgi:hypothetical protein